MRSPKTSPTIEDVKTAILLFPGPVVTYRTFRQCAPRFVRGSTKQEYVDAIEELKPQLGSLINIRVARSIQATKTFVKQHPDAFTSWPFAHLCGANDYACKFALPIPKSISRNVKDVLLRQDAITQEQYDA